MKIGKIVKGASKGCHILLPVYFGATPCGLPKRHSMSLLPRFCLRAAFWADSILHLSRILSLPFEHSGAAECTSDNWDLLVAWHHDLSRPTSAHVRNLVPIPSLLSPSCLVQTNTTNNLLNPCLLPSDDQCSSAASKAGWSFLLSGEVCAESCYSSNLANLFSSISQPSSHSPLLPLPLKFQKPAGLRPLRTASPMLGWEREWGRPPQAFQGLPPHVRVSSTDNSFSLSANPGLDSPSDFHLRPPLKLTSTNPKTINNP